MRYFLFALVIPFWLHAQPDSLVCLVSGKRVTPKLVNAEEQHFQLTYKSTATLAIFDATSSGQQCFVLQDQHGSVLEESANFAIYTNLTPGIYTLFISHCTEQAFISTSRLDLIVTKDNTWIYLPAFILYLLLLSSAAVYVITVNRMRSRYKIHTMRSEWTKRLHTDLGGDLLGVSGRITMAQQELRRLIFSTQNNLAKAQIILQGIERKLRFIFDLIDPNKNSLQTVLNDVHWHAQECFALKGIQLDYRNDLPENDLVKIDLARIEKLGLILKELVNNCYKHANASLFVMHIQRIRKGIRIHVLDNGQGFDLAAKLNEPDQTNGQSNGGRIGLKSLFSLAKDGLMDFEMHATVGNGVVVTMFLPEM